LKQTFYFNQNKFFKKPISFALFVGYLVASMFFFLLIHMIFFNLIELVLPIFVKNMDPLFITRCFFNILLFLAISLFYLFYLLCFSQLLYSWVESVSISNPLTVFYSFIYRKYIFLGLSHLGSIIFCFMTFCSVFFLFFVYDFLGDLIIYCHPATFDEFSPSLDLIKRAPSLVMESFTLGELTVLRDIALVDLELMELYTKYIQNTRDIHFTPSVLKYYDSHLSFLVPQRPLSWREPDITMTSKSLLAAIKNLQNPVLLNYPLFSLLDIENTENNQHLFINLNRFVFSNGPSYMSVYTTFIRNLDTLSCDQTSKKLTELTVLLQHTLKWKEYQKILFELALEHQLTPLKRTLDNDLNKFATEYYENNEIPPNPICRTAFSFILSILEKESNMASISSSEAFQALKVPSPYSVTDPERFYRNTNFNLQKFLKMSLSLDSTIMCLNDCVRSVGHGKMISPPVELKAIRNFLFLYEPEILKTFQFLSSGKIRTPHFDMPSSLTVKFDDHVKNFCSSCAPLTSFPTAYEVPLGELPVKSSRSWTEWFWSWFSSSNKLKPVLETSPKTNVTIYNEDSINGMDGVTTEIPLNKPFTNLVHNPFNNPLTAKSLINGFCNVLFDILANGCKSLYTLYTWCSSFFYTPKVGGIAPIKTEPVHNLFGGFLNIFWRW
jgi:hypothetical protein